MLAKNDLIPRAAVNMSQQKMPLLLVPADENSRKSQIVSCRIFSRFFLKDEMQLFMQFLSLQTLNQPNKLVAISCWNNTMQKLRNYLEVEIKVNLKSNQLLQSNFSTHLGIQLPEMTYTIIWQSSPYQLSMKIILWINQRNSGESKNQIHI